MFVERCRERVRNMDEVRWELDPEGMGSERHGLFLLLVCHARSLKR